MLRVRWKVCVGSTGDDGGDDSESADECAERGDHDDDVACDWYESDADACRLRESGEDGEKCGRCIARIMAGRNEEL